MNELTRPNQATHWHRLSPDCAIHREWERIRAAAIDGVPVPPSVSALRAQHGSGCFIKQFRSSGDWLLGHRFKTGKSDDRGRDGRRIDGHPGFSVVMLIEKAVEESGSSAPEFLRGTIGT
jgi:hypothetical protein